MSGGFFRGTSADQDTRFSNKQSKLLKSQKFPPELDHLVDVTKVKMDVIRPWIATRATELLGFEDEVLINFVYGLLDGKVVDGKKIQIQLTGFMEKNTGKFMKELWGLLLSAQNNASGVPQQFLDAKEEETRKKKAETDRIASEIQKRRERDGREPERERKSRFDGEADFSRSDNADISRLEKATHDLVVRISKRRSSSVQPEEEREFDAKCDSRTVNGRSQSPKPKYHSPSPYRSAPSPTRSDKKSISRSRSDSGKEPRSRSVSMSSESQRRSTSPRRQYQSPARRSLSPQRQYRSRRSISPRRRYSPRITRSPSRRRSPGLRRRSSRSPSPYQKKSPRARQRSPQSSRRRSSSLSRRRSPSPLRRRSSPQFRRRSPPTFRRRSPPPFRRRSPTPVRHRSPTPVRRRSPSPLSHRSPVKARRRSPSPLSHRSPVKARRRSPSPLSHRSPVKARRRSPSPLRHRSPMHRRSLSPPRRRSPSPRRRSPPRRSPKGRGRSPVRSPDGHPADSQYSSRQRKRSSSPYRSRSPLYRARRSLSKEIDDHIDGHASIHYRDDHTTQRPLEKISPVNLALDRKMTERAGSGHKASEIVHQKAPIPLRSPQHDSRNQNEQRDKMAAAVTEDSPGRLSSPANVRKMNPRTSRRSPILSGSPSRQTRTINPRYNSPGISREEEQTVHARESSRHKTDSSHKKIKSSRDVGLKNSQQRSDAEFPERSVPQVSYSSDDIEYGPGSVREERGTQGVVRDIQRSSKLLPLDEASLAETSLNEKTTGYGVSDGKRSQPRNKEHRKPHHETESIASSKRKDGIENQNDSKDSDSGETDSDKYRTMEKRRLRKSDKRKRDSDESSNSDSQVDDRKEAKRRRKDEKRRRKEERRRRREERHHKRLEHRASKNKEKSVEVATLPSVFDEKHNDPDNSDAGADPRKNLHPSEADETESEQKRLEIELRMKALESLKAKKAISH